MSGRPIRGPSLGKKQSIRRKPAGAFEFARDAFVRSLRWDRNNASNKNCIYQTHPDLGDRLFHDLRPRADGAITDGGADTRAKSSTAECGTGAGGKPGSCGERAILNFRQCTRYSAAANQRPGP